tara:strand:- start:73 stop:459 length:387 start_codon:yes stop_codon:yes gene_type:complete
MINRFFYIRDVADEINDDDASASMMVPMENITAIAPGSAITELDVWFRHGKNESHQAQARLTVTKGKLKEVTAAIVSAMNAGPHHDGVTVLADVCTTSNGATSIEGNDAVKTKKFLHPDITGVQVSLG